MLPLMLNLYVMRLGEAGAALHPRIDSEISNNLDYIAGALGQKDYLLGDFTGADLQMSFVMEVARAFGRPLPLVADFGPRPPADSGRHHGPRCRRQR